MPRRKLNRKPLLKREEHAEQAALFQWAELASRVSWPEVGMMFAIPNQRASPTERRRMAEEGAKSGVPDIVLPVPRGGYAGLFIELKVGDNKPTANQKAWLEALRALGYMAVARWGWEAAKETIINYLEQGG